VRVRGVVYNRKTRRPMQARIFYETLPEGEEIGTIESDPLTGEYQIILPTGSMYGYLAEAEGFVAINANIDLKDTKVYGELNKDLYLVPIETGAVVMLNNIFFDFDKSELKEASFPELKRVIKLMNDNPDMRISIEGHTDDIGTVEYNIGLSQRRADAVVKYLTDNGIDPGRLETKGWGKSKPLVSNDDEVGGRAINRRVEFVILEE